MRASLLGAVALVLTITDAAGQTSYSPLPRSGQLAGFGSAMAIVGSEVAVGRGGGGATNPRGGGVHFFRRGSDGNWTQSTSIEAADAKPGDAFGASLAFEGEWLAVGAPNSGSGGAVYLFQRTSDGWRQAARVAPADVADGDLFGASVAIRNGILVVGAPGRDSARGAAYAVRREGTNWATPAVIARGGEAHERLANRVAFDGTRLLLSATGPSGGFGGGGTAGQRPRPGAAVAYRLNGTQWTEDGRLTAPPTDSVVTFGAAVELAGGEAFVSAPTASGNRGSVYHFRRAANGGWTMVGRLVPSIPNVAPTPGGGLPPTFMIFGSAIAVAGNDVLVGAPLAGQFAGATYVFGKTGDNLAEKQRLVVGADAQLGFGTTMAASATMAVIGAPQADFGEGLAYVFTKNAAGQWTEAGKLVDPPFTLPAIAGSGEKKCEASAIEGFGCQEVDLMAFMPISAIGGKRGVRLNDIWGWTDPETDREYALVGRVDGTSFVDVTDPNNPKYIGDLPLTKGAKPNVWRDIKVYKDHAYIVADGAGQHGMQVFDLTKLRNPGATPATFTPDFTYDKIASAHNIAINEETGFAYPIGNSGGGETCGGALHMIDIREPKTPKFAGCWADKSTGNAKTGYTHDAMCVTYRGPDTRYAGKEICFNASETAVGIADVTDKANPKAIAVAAYPNTAYAHQGWLTEDHKYFYLNDEGDEISGLVPKTRTLVWDVTKLDEPVLVKEFLGTTAASDHNLYIRGRYMYQSNYVAGLRVVDIADPANPVEVGYFDTVPWGENEPGFEGSWSNYPYFKSGNIIVSSISQGLFILKHRKMSPVP